MRYGDRYVDTRETEQGKKRSHYYIGSNLKRFITLPLILKVSIKHLRYKTINFAILFYPIHKGDYKWSE